VDRAQQKDLVLTNYAQNLIKFKARQLGQRRDFQSEEREDLQQELWLAVVKAADEFDASLACLDTFIDRIVNTAVAMLVRARSCRKRGNGHRIDSLDSQRAAAGETCEPLTASISAADLARRTGAVPQDEALRREDAEAFEYALAHTSQEISDRCRQVMGGTVASVARELGISRRQVRKTLKTAQPFFERAGLNPE